MSVDRKNRLHLWQRRLIAAAAVVFCLLCTTCNGYEHPTIPEVAVNFTIYPNSVDYLDLNYYGGYVYLTGGVAGIIVYRLDYSTFFAYDRACPHDWQDREAWIKVEESGLTLIDEHCGSRFNILDGSVVNGPSKYPLKAYRTRYDGMILKVYN